MLGNRAMTCRTEFFTTFIILPFLVNSKQIVHTSTVADCYDKPKPLLIQMYPDDELTVMLPTGGPVDNDDFRCEWQVELLTSENDTDTNIYFPVCNVYNSNIFNLQLMEFAGNIPNTDNSTTNQAQCTAVKKTASFM